MIVCWYGVSCKLVAVSKKKSKKKNHGLRTRRKRKRSRWDTNSENVSWLDINYKDVNLKRLCRDNSNFINL